MAQREYRCGSSSAVYQAPRYRPARPGRPERALAREDREPVRLRTALHVGGVHLPQQSFRVLAELAGGGTALLCLGADRDEALSRARALAAPAVRLCLQQWVGGACVGSWRALPCPRSGLPRARRAGLRRRRRGGAAPAGERLGVLGS
jgi:hypothetical protein